MNAVNTYNTTQQKMGSSNQSQMVSQQISHQNLQKSEKSHQQLQRESEREDDNLIKVH